MAVMYHPQFSDLVVLGIPDEKTGFKVIGAVLSPSQEMLVADMLQDGGINFAGGASYNLNDFGEDEILPSLL